MLLCVQRSGARGRSTAGQEAAVLEAISGAKGRGKSGLTTEQLDAFDAAVTALEEDGGVQVPSYFSLCRV